MNPIIPPTAALLQGRFIETLGWTLAHSLWELPAVAAVVGILLTFLRRGSAQVRYVVACAGLLAMVGVLGGTYAYLLPAEVRVVAPAPLPVMQTKAPAAVELAKPPTAVELPPLVVSEVTKAVALPWRVRLERAVEPWLPTAVGCYFAGMLLMAMRLALGYARLRSLTRGGVAIRGGVRSTLDALLPRMGVTRAVRLLECQTIEVPTLLGVIKPVILLPAAALAGLSPAQLEALLAHELAHIRRHDYVANLVQSILETILFYHPAVWWLSGRIRQEREHCCDDAVVALTSDRLTYARALASMESLRAAGVAALAARGGALLPRIRRLLGMTPVPRRFLTTTVAGLLVTLLAALIYVGCCQTTTTSWHATDPAPVAVGTGPIQVRVRLLLVPTKTVEDAIAQAKLSLTHTTSPANTHSPVPSTGTRSSGTPGNSSLRSFSEAPSADLGYRQFDTTDDASLRRFLEIVQADRFTVTITAPTLGVTSGQEAALDMTQSQNYVKGYKKTAASAPAGTASSTPEPEIATLKTGVEIHATATLQDDHRILTALHPKITWLDGMDTFTVSDSPETAKLIADPASAKVPFIQVPRVSTMEYNTTIPIADGGAFLLLGQKYIGEREVQTSTPVLSAIPGIGRAFTNRAYIRDERTLVTIVQPTTKVPPPQPFDDLPHPLPDGLQTAPALRFIPLSQPAATGPQIRFETRVYVVPRNFLDDFRIGWDLSVPTATTLPGTNGQKANGSVLDNWQLSLLMNAAQAERRTFTANASPTILAPAQEGRLDFADLHLNITPQISPDGRSIILDMGDKSQANRPQTENTKVSIPVGGTLLIGGQGSFQQAANTTVSLPTGGTPPAGTRNAPSPADASTLLLIRPTIVKPATLVSAPALASPIATNQLALPIPAPPRVTNTPGDSGASPFSDNALADPSRWPKNPPNRSGVDAALESAPNRAVRERLEEPLKEITADQQGLEKLLNYVRDSMGVNIFLNWTELQKIQVERNTPVTLSLKGAPFRKVLITILAQVSTEKGQLGYSIDDGIITISTKDDLASTAYQTVRVFDVRDLLVLPTDASKTRDQLATDLMDTIKSTVASDSWRDTGGTIGSIRELNGQLIVSQSSENQIGLYKLLQAIRATRGLAPEGGRPGLPAATQPTPPAANAAPSNAPAALSESPQNRAARNRLEENLKELTADQQDLEKVLNYVRDNMGANIFVDWAALQKVGIKRTTPVSVSLKEVPFRRALTLILAQISNDKAQLAYTIDDGIITISTKEDLSSARFQIVKVHDVRDLLALHLDAAKTHEELASDLMDLIKVIVDPDSWRDAGGTVGSMRELNGQLIVNQTAENQTAVSRLLQQVRVSHGLTGEAEKDLFGVGYDRPTGLPATAPATSPAAATTSARGTLDGLAVQRERILTLYSESKRASDEALAKQKFAVAKALAQQALDLINLNPTLLSDVERAALADGAQRQIDNVNRQSATSRPSAMAKQPPTAVPSTTVDPSEINEALAKGQIVPIPLAGAHTAKELRSEKVATLITDAQKLYNATQFREAADLLRQALVIDPQNENATLFLRLVMNRIGDHDSAQAPPTTGAGANEYLVAVPHASTTTVKPAQGFDYVFNTRLIEVPDGLLDSLPDNLRVQWNEFLPFSEPGAISATNKDRTLKGALIDRWALDVLLSSQPQVDLMRNPPKHPAPVRVSEGQEGRLTLGNALVRFTATPSEDKRYVVLTVYGSPSTAGHAAAEQTIRVPDGGTLVIDGQDLTPASPVGSTAGKHTLLVLRPNLILALPTSASQPATAPLLLNPTTLPATATQPAATRD